jgi:hypothetical protein
MGRPRLRSPHLIRRSSSERPSARWRGLEYGSRTSSCDSAGARRDHRDRSHHDRLTDRSARGATVFATAGRRSAARVAGYGADLVLDYHDPSGRSTCARRPPHRCGVGAAVNAARGGAALAFQAVADHGRLATITGDPPGTRTRRHRQRRLRPSGRRRPRRAGNSARRRAALSRRLGRLAPFHSFLGAPRGREPSITSGTSSRGSGSKPASSLFWSTSRRFCSRSSSSRLRAHVARVPEQRDLSRGVGRG